MFEFIRPIFKNLFHKPSTRNYPAQTRVPFEGGRGCIDGIDADKCIFCGLCEKKCPADAIKVDRAERIWKINRYKCVICNVCVEICPKKCINMSNIHLKPEYAKEILTISGPKKEAKTADTPTGSNITGIDAEKCVYCTLCAKKCPVDAITVNRAEKTWEIDQEKCIKCMECVKVCPKKCINTD